MMNFSKWSEVRADVVNRAGGEQRIVEARKHNQAHIDGHRLAERCNVTPHEQMPLLFLDIDGTILPFGGAVPHESSCATADSHLERLNPQLGIRLAVLPCELVWATTWEDDANIAVAPRIGLPPLRVMHWPEPSAAHEHEDQWFGLHWKTRALVDWAGGRPFVWVDDEITDADGSMTRSPMLTVNG